MGWNIEPQATGFLVNGGASGHATPLGNYTMNFQEQVNFVIDGSVGTMVFTVANGDQVWATFVGYGANRSYYQPSSYEVATITGGTGRLVGATGTFTAQLLM